MKIVLFGATGMVGQGVLRECLRDPEVEGVLAVGRTATGRSHPKLREVVRADVGDLADLGEELSAYDACFFCLGVSAAGMDEQDYRRITYDLTLRVAEALAAHRPGMAFVYVSGAGTDSSERGRMRWARVKGATENALFRLPLDAYAFRPAYVQPQHGVTSRTRWYRLAYAVAAPLHPLLRRLAPGLVTTTENLGRAMIAVARDGWRTRVLPSHDINAAASARPPAG
ncbi:epimerase [Streptomyces sp. CC53]|uniref:NAD(P)H-binding protein n=1 Tax=unclassified Streptomyces TaxID=2593676 RepID=UPI0008DC5BF7|nr:MULTISPECIES: NAD(P)H-binding protein [unclassified Streptomyces]OII61965.1 epimerase [Streptomyces sp. CC53]